MSGLFWRPDNSEETVAGRLIIRDGGVVEVELNGSITPELRIESHDSSTGETTMVPADDPPEFVIHGIVIDDPKRVSLLGCWTASRTVVHTNAGVVETQTVRAGRLMRGDFIAEDDTKFSGVRLRVAGIDAWAGLPRATYRKLEGGGVQFLVAPLGLESITTPSGATLTLDEETRIFQRTNGETVIKRAMWVRLSDFPVKSYREIDAEYVTPLMCFLSFSLRVSAPLTGLQVFHDDQWIGIVHGGVTAEKDDSISRSDVILPLHVSGLDSISSFLDIYQKLGPAVPITRDALSNDRRATLDTQALELTTVAEGLHRDLYPNQERMSKEDAARVRHLVRDALKDEADTRFSDIATGTVLNFLQEPNYRSRLKCLTDAVAEALPELVGDQKKWIERVDGIRNSFAHRKGGFIGAASIDEMYVVTQSLIWLFWALILLKSGMAAETLKERTEQSQRYQFFLRHAREMAPLIYAKPK